MNACTLAKSPAVELLAIPAASFGPSFSPLLEAALAEAPAAADPYAGIIADAIARGFTVLRGTVDIRVNRNYAKYGSKGGKPYAACVDGGAETDYMEVEMPLGCQMVIQEGTKCGGTGPAYKNRKSIYIQTPLAFVKL